VISLDAGTVLLQWATGGLAFLWVTTRRREVGIGYGWLLRSVFGLLAVGAVVVGQLTEPVPGRDAGAALVAVATAVALAVSIVRRKAGVAGERARNERKAARVAAMLGPDADAATVATVPVATTPVDAAPDHSAAPRRPEFPPALDLVAPAVGFVALVLAALATGGPTALAIVRALSGAVFLGAVTDAMLLGHWYLVQPGLDRAPLLELVRWVAWSWPFEIAALLWPPGMLDVLSGKVDDGWGGTLGWFWVACAVTTLALAFVTRAALKERAYSAVMAATGLLYLAILTAFGTDLIARAVLSP
jgi:hypothetical protein